MHDDGTTSRFVPDTSCWLVVGLPIRRTAGDWCHNFAKRADMFVAKTGNGEHIVSLFGCGRFRSISLSLAAEFAIGKL